MSSFIGVSTAVAILSGVLLLGESFTFIQILGVLLIMLGVYISNRG
ncbi:EamA family transporter [Streptococcus penaeicida]|nr:EamA family transporter [Streptococcus penaeicida]